MMKTAYGTIEVFLWALCLGALSLLSLSACAGGRALPAAPLEQAVAQNQAQNWLSSLGSKGLQLQHTFATAKNVPVIESSNSIVLLEDNAYYVSLGFSPALEATDSLEAMNRKLSYVALDRLPTPGLELAGWAIRPQTPASSFKEGVRLEAGKKGMLLLVIDTEAFALMGRKILNEPQPADKPLPPGSYFQIRQTFPMHLRLEFTPANAS